MSGGSYNYLYMREPEDLVDVARGDLGAMRDRLAELRLYDVASAVEEIQATITRYHRDVHQQMQKVRDVLQAVEWLDSNDWSEDQVHEAVAKYRADDETDKP